MSFIGGQGPCIHGMHGDCHHCENRAIQAQPGAGINSATPEEWDKAAAWVRGHPCDIHAWDNSADPCPYCADEQKDPTDEELEKIIDDHLPFKALDRQVGGSHYKDCPIQPIEYIMANELPYCEANIVKYITRHAKKGGAKDIEKVIHYAQLLLEEEYK